MSETEEFKALLALQNEIDQKLDELVTRIKAIQTTHKGRIVATIDGELYELARNSEYLQAIDSCRKYGGFFCEYRLVKLPEPIQ